MPKLSTTKQQENTHPVAPRIGNDLTFAGGVELSGGSKDRSLLYAMWDAEKVSRELRDSQATLAANQENLAAEVGQLVDTCEKLTKGMEELNTAIVELTDVLKDCSNSFEKSQEGA